MTVISHRVTAPAGRAPRPQSGARRIATLALLVVAVCVIALLPAAATAMATDLPHITSLSKTHAKTGTSLTITGYGFGATQGDSYVHFKSEVGPGAVISWSDTQIVCTVPENSHELVTLNQVWVWVDPTGPNPRMSNELDFEIEGPTWVGTMSPTHGAPGTTITLTGHGFIPAPGSSWIVLYGYPTPPVPTSKTDTRLTFVLPNITTGHHSIGVGSEWGSPPVGHTANVHTFNVDPAIATLSPAKGKPGVTVTLTGTGFGRTRGTSKVLYGAKAATTYVSWSDTQVKVKVPALAAGAKTVKVVTPQGTTAGKGFRVL